MSSKNPKRKIFPEDRIFAAENKNGNWYLSFTTKDPEEKFKMRKIADIDGKPPKEFIEEKEVKNDRARFYLDKEKCADFIEETYKFYVVDEPNPWAPKKFGEKRSAPVKDSSSSTDSDDDDDVQPSKKKPCREVNPENEDKVYKIIQDCYALLLEMSTHVRSATAPPSAPTPASSL